MPYSVFLFNGTATTQIYTLSLHDALPISFDKNGKLAVGDFPAQMKQVMENIAGILAASGTGWERVAKVDRKSTRLNSSHEWISYAVFCLKKKKINTQPRLSETRMYYMKSR